MASVASYRHTTQWSVNELISMLWSLLFGSVIGVGLPWLNVGLILFWLVVVIHIILASIVLITIVQNRRRPIPSASTGGHLTEYVVLSLTFDSGLIPAYWLKVPWHNDNIIIILLACLVLGAAILGMRRLVAKEK